MTGVTVRIAAIAIVVAAAVDPSIAIDTATRPRIAVVVQDGYVPDAARVRDDLRGQLGADHDVVPHLVSDAAAAIVIGDRYPSDPVPTSMQVMTVTIPQPGDGVRIVRIAAPGEVPPATRIRVEVDVDAPSAAGRTTELRARVGGTDSSMVSHRWTRPDERWRASLDVVPAIASLRAYADEIRAAELAKLGALPDDERRTIESVTAQILNKLLHLPTVRMKEAALAADGAAYAEAVRHLFGLEEKR
jgi:hypothetical protein